MSINLNRQEKIFQGDSGTIILIDCNESINAASNVMISVKEPNGNVVNWLGNVYSNNYIFYTLSANDISQTGIYKLQPRITIGNFVGRADTVEIRVFPPFEENFLT